MNTEAVNAYPLAFQWEPFRVAETPAEYVFHRPRLYLETTIASYLTARPSRDLNKARLQRITSQWWNSWRTQFDIFVSDLVIEEAIAGDPEAAIRRLSAIQRFTILKPSDRTETLKRKIMEGSGLPESATRDAHHVALATVYAMDFLISWNFAHLVNDQIASRVKAICWSEGHLCPIVCTPEQLMERYEHAGT